MPIPSKASLGSLPTSSPGFSVAARERSVSQGDQPLGLPSAYKLLLAAELDPVPGVVLLGMGDDRGCPPASSLTLLRVPPSYVYGLGR
jgi:hypothetical protein